MWQILLMSLAIPLCAFGILGAVALVSLVRRVDRAIFTRTGKRFATIPSWVWCLPWVFIAAPIIGLGRFFDSESIDRVMAETMVSELPAKDQLDALSEILG